MTPTDFTYFKLIGWGWVYLSTVLDDYSRYIISWKLCTTMTAGDVTDTLDLALAASGCDSATVLHKPRLLSDNGPSYVAGELAAYIEAQAMSHVRGAPFHPQAQGKIERWHQTLKNRILLENYYLPGDLEAQIEAFIEHYNNQRYHLNLHHLQGRDPDAMMMAIWRRGKPDALLHHWDQGSQHTSEQFQRLMLDNGVTCPMSRSGNCWDNAAMESFFSSLKIERVRKKVYRSRDQARADVFDYIECFYNPTRRHSTLGYLSPIDFERQAGVA